MADELGGGADGRDQPAQPSGRQPSGRGDPQGLAQRRDAARAGELAGGAAGDPAERRGLRPPRPAAGAGGARRRHADERDPVLARQAEDDGEEPRQGVEVLVGVEVDHRQPRRQQALDLPAQLALDLLAADPAAQVAADERRPTRQQRAVPAEEARHLARRRQRALPDQRQVRPDVELRPRPQALHGVVEGAPVGGDAHRGHDAVLVGVQRAAVERGMEPDVVGGDDEAPHPRAAGAPAGAASPGAGAGRARRRGRRISGYRRTSSRRMRRMTAGEESVERPRVRGK